MQGKLDPRGRLCCLCCPRKTSTPPSSRHIWHSKNRWKWITNEKVMAPQSIGGSRTQKKHHRTLQRLVTKLPKNRPFLLFLALVPTNWGVIACHIIVLEQFMNMYERHEEFGRWGLQMLRWLINGCFPYSLYINTLFLVNF